MKITIGIGLCLELAEDDSLPLNHFNVDKGNNVLYASTQTLYTLMMFYDIPLDEIIKHATDKIMHSVDADIYWIKQRWYMLDDFKYIGFISHSPYL